MHRRFSLSWNMRALLAAAVAVVCLAPLRAQTSYNAVVVEQLGQVSTLDGGLSKALFQGSAISPQQLVVTGPDGYAKFQVSDGSTFEVFSNSRVVFRENLGNWKDLLNVWIGRVKVFIQHEPGKPNHNEVSSPTAVISVRGTVFDVVVEDVDGTTLVTVDEGVVTVRNFTAPGPIQVLNPGDFVRVLKGQPLLGKQIDKGNILYNAMKVLRDAVYQALIQRQGGGGPIPSGGPVAQGGNQGDKGKGGTTGDTGKAGTTGSTPPAPGAPPAPGGGH
jgi:hypothetical protein